MLCASSPTTVMFEWRAAHSSKDARLQYVGVLVFVDEHVVVQPGDLLRELRRSLEHQRPEKQQIVVVDEIALLLSRGVVGEDLREILEVVDELRIFVADDVVDGEYRC